MKYITSKDNPILKKAARLKLKKYRSRENLFLLEGKNLVREALTLGHYVMQLFVDNQRAAEFEDLINLLSPRECYRVSSGALDLLCDTENPQGIVAVMPIPRHNFEKLSGQEGTMIFLDHLADPGNMGTIIRTGWALGAAAILLSPGCVDPFNSKVVRASMGGVLSLPVLEDVTASNLLELKNKGFKLLCTSLQAKHNLYDLDLGGKTLFIIGNESQGVSTEILNTADISFKIPMHPGVDSLNVAVACGILMSEAWRRRIN